jgi:hypothetical protein
LDRRGLSETLDRHLDGEDNFFDEIDRALTIAVGYRLLLSGSRPAAPEPRPLGKVPVREPRGG